MATILSIKAEVEDKIRSRSAPGSILRGDHSNIEDSLANEIRDRGCLQLANTGALATASHDNTKLILIKTVGFFVALETADPADDIDTFASADAGWLWEKVIGTVGGGSGYAAPIWKEADGDMTAGETTFVDASLIGATEMNYIIVNKVIEFIEDDFSFDNSTGTITRTNQWQEDDKMVTPHKPA